MSDTLNQDQAQKRAATLRVGDRDYVIPPMKFGVIRQVWPMLGKLAEMAATPTNDPKFLQTHADRLDMLIDVIVQAAAKLHPQLTVDFLRDNMSLEETRLIPQTFNDLLEVSGFATGEAIASGLQDQSTSSTLTSSATSSQS